MKYYVIEEFINGKGLITKPLFVVEKEEIAKDLVKRYNLFAYVEFDTEENKDE